MVLGLGRGFEGFAQQALHHQHVLPLPVEAAVAAMNADLAPPTGPHQGNARFVRGEDLADQLVVAAALRLLGESVDERRPGACAPCLQSDVEGRLADPA
jgi:hypothetical protein